MSSKQTRRSISVRGTTYVTLRQYCEEHDRSMSDLVEELLAKVFEASAGVTPMVKAAAPAKSVKTAKPVAAPQAMAAKILRAAPPKAAPPKAAPAKAAPAVMAKPAPAKPAPPQVKAAPAKPMPAPPAAGQNGAGRPAPTPAKAVVADRVVAPKGDYRVISF